MAWQAMIPGILGAIGGLMGASQGTPSPPQFQRPNVQWADRRKEMDAILAGGFDPQSELYRLASMQMREGINQELARRGLLGSSAGMAQLSGSEADLQRKLLENELQRRIQAFQSVNQYEQQKNALEAGLTAQANEMAWKGYQSDLDKHYGRQAAFQGLLGGIGSAVGGYQGAKQWEDVTAPYMRAQTGYYQAMTPQIAPTGGAVVAPISPGTGYLGVDTRLGGR